VRVEDRAVTQDEISLTDEIPIDENDRSQT
jgi:hypothetical protein